MAFIEDPVNFEANQTGLSRSQQREAVKQEQRALNAANEGKVDADGNAYVPLVVDGIVGPKTEAAKNFKPVVSPSGTNNNDDPAQVVPSDQTTDSDGETRYIQNEDGAWYNNPAFYEKPVKPADADSAPPDANGNYKYFTTTDAKGNTVWNINPDYQGASGKAKDDSNQETINAFKEWTLSQKQAAEAAAEANLQSAREILAGLVSDFGLPSSLAETLNSELIRGESPTALAMRIRTTDEYKARFPGMAQRRELGLPAISETEYLNIERQYRSIMQAAKLPATFHDAPEDFDQWIAGDVSPQEFQERVTLAETARDSADQETRRLLTEFYNISDGDLTAYYLDPTRAETIFEDRRQLESAGLAAASRQIVGAALDVETAEALQKENVQRREIQQRLGQRRALTDTILGEDEALTASDIASAEFGLEGDDVTAMRRRREERATGFRGRSGALATASGITTLGEAE